MQCIHTPNRVIELFEFFSPLNFIVLVMSRINNNALVKIDGKTGQHLKVKENDFWCNCMGNVTLPQKKRVSSAYWRLMKELVQPLAPVAGSHFLKFSVQ